MFDRRGNRNRAAQHLREHRQPAQHLHSAHRAARHRKQLRNAEMVNQAFLTVHHIFNRNQREREAIRLLRRGIDAGRPGRAFAAAEHIGANDKILVRVERLAGANHVIPPARLFVAFVKSGGMSVAGKGMQNQDRVRFIRIQRAIRFVGNGNWSELFAAFERQFGKSKILRLDNADAAFICHNNLPPNKDETSQDKDDTSQVSKTCEVLLNRYA